MSGDKLSISMKDISTEIEKEHNEIIAWKNQQIKNVSDNIKGKYAALYALKAKEAKRKRQINEKKREVENKIEKKRLNLMEIEEQILCAAKKISTAKEERFRSCMRNKHIQESLENLQKDIQTSLIKFNKELDNYDNSHRMSEESGQRFKFFNRMRASTSQFRKEREKEVTRKIKDGIQTTDKSVQRLTMGI